MAYHLEEMSKEEGEKLTAELQEVLAKYNAEIGVTSNINLMKRVENSEPSPFQANESGDITEKETE